MEQIPQSGGSANAFIEFIDVCKSYDGERMAVAGLDLSIGHGEFLTLLGPSGSGKTSVLMMLAGFEAASGGEIRVRGRPISHLPPHKRNIGVVFQSYALFPHMTVAENIAFPLTVRRVGAQETRERVARALELVRMPQLGSRRPDQLSGGQQQRVALARALVFNPDLILMDEPLGALDKQLRDQLQYEIKQVQRKLGVTVVYVTHDQSEALTMSDRIAIFKDGAIEQLGTPEEIYERPGSPFVAEFVGESNRLEGTIIATQSDHWVVRLNDYLCVHARGTGEGVVGNRVVLCIRPERLAINQGGAPPANYVEASVDQVIYQGSQVRVQANLKRGPALFAHLPNQSRPHGLRSGDLIRIGWSVADCRAYALRAPAQSEAASAPPPAVSRKAQ